MLLHLKGGDTVVVFFQLFLPIFPTIFIHFSQKNILKFRFYTDIIISTDFQRYCREFVNICHCANWLHCCVSCDHNNTQSILLFIPTHTILLHLSFIITFSHCRFHSFRLHTNTSRFIYSYRFTYIFISSYITTITDHDILLVQYLI